MSVSIAQAQLFFLAFVRIMAVLMHVPVLGGQSIPAQVRIGLGVLLAAVLIPWQPLGPDAPAMTTYAFGISIGREFLIGSLSGFAASLAFAAVQIAGEAMGINSGFTSSRLFNPALGETTSAYDQLFLMVAMLFFLVIDGHHLVLLALSRTFDLLPLLSPVPLDAAEPLLRLAAQLFTSGIHLALPVMCALLLTDFVLGLLARVAPQVQVYFLGLPLKVGVSLAGLGLTLAVLLPAIGGIYRNIGLNMVLGQ